MSPNQEPIAACTCDPGLPAGVTNAQCPQHGILAFMRGEAVTREPYELLADEINQFAMAVEVLTEHLRHDPHVSAAVNQGARRVFAAARTLRENIAELIPE